MQSIRLLLSGGGGREGLKLQELILVISMKLTHSLLQCVVLYGKRKKRGSRLVMNGCQWCDHQCDC